MASTHRHCTLDWDQRIFAVDSSPTLGITEPFYFTSQSNIPPDLPGTSPEWPMLVNGGAAHSVCVTIPHPVRAARLYRALGPRVSQAVPAGCKVLKLLSYLPGDPHRSLASGFLICDPQSGTDTVDRLRALLGEHRPHLYFCSYRQIPGGEVRKEPWGENGEPMECTRVVRVGAPDLSPFEINIQHCAVYNSLDRARTVLQECSTFIPEATNVLDLLSKSNTSSGKGRFPVIVVEGLDATGKSTLTKTLQESLKATLLISPPDCINQWRKRFDEEPTLIKRAYYAAGNYIVASEIAKGSMQSPVIVDRYWHSTAAYAIATETGGSVQNLPSRHHEIYQWPNDLLRPDLVILLTVCDEERIKRMQRRGLEETKEEKELKSNSMFRQKVEEVYKRIENPQCIIIDASFSKEMVFNEALSIIKKKCAI
ncbi:hypothetical protein GDO86_010399 [Hymenochirus boettgeri]|uniref:UMP-CMP kinase 2, mitochondrial n=1 Tax=Hymenochirus boettgeri TaxID=247094 RepID=A0A8T2JMW0_9PIPI|nr:hypothetical protein GDO86_010399 [Hymenochirus boettgeri]